MNPIVIIPARLASFRLPKKLLADIHGRPLINWVVQAALDAKVGPVAVACCGPEIESAIKSEFPQVNVVITDPDLPSGTDRVHAALKAIDPEGKHDIIINMQGDLPDFPPSLLRKTLEPFKASAAVDIATLAYPIQDAEEVTKPNIVKIAMAPPAEVTQGISNALYFSRSPVPANAEQYYHHIGVYAYRRAALERLVTLPPSPLEKIESLEQLRALEAGMRIDVAVTPTNPMSVDVPEDLEMARQALLKQA